MAWNLIEAAIGMVVGLAAGSVALVGFALDSVVEGSSGAILIWRLRSEASGRHSGEVVERKAILLLSWAFLLLAAYVGIRSAMDLLTQARPEESIPGIILALVSLALPFLW